MTVCGSVIHFPPASCTRPFGHAGEHMTAEIPAPLSAVAARMVTESDRLESERRQQQAEHDRMCRRARWAIRIGVAAVLVNIGIAIAQLAHHITAFPL